MFNAGRPCASSAQNVTKALWRVTQSSVVGSRLPWPVAQFPAFTCRGTVSLSSRKRGSRGRKKIERGEGDRGGGKRWKRGGVCFFEVGPSYKTIFVRWTRCSHAARAQGSSGNINMGVSGRDLEEECEVCWVRIKGAERQAACVAVCLYPLLPTPRHGRAPPDRLTEGAPSHLQLCG